MALKPIKMKIDNSPETIRRKTAATGAYSMDTPAVKAADVISKRYATSHNVNVPITKNAQFAGSGANAVWAQPMFFSPLHTPQNWQIASKRREIYQWSRFYYMNEPKVAAGVDFYSNFSMNGFKLECKKKKILKYFERAVDKLELAERLNEISHEYFLLGDVFPFLEIDCPHCRGGGVKPDGKPCNHPDGGFKSVKILNPDYMDIKTNSIANDPKFFLKPDEELKMLVSRKEPRDLYESLPKELINLISTGQDIPLSDRSISHIRHNASPYGTYGVSMLQRLFTMLAYKTKIMTANWIIAERLILPVRVVKVGDEKRPATEEDLQDVVQQLGAVANDPNLTIVTHHAFDYEWYGATGKIHNITQELEHIGKEILDGLMLNQAILNGEMGGYNCMDEKTLTLTDSGFKKYDEIDKNDKIACYNPDTKEMEYHPYIEKWVYDYEGEMIHFQTDKIDFLCTPNHKMYSQKRDGNKYDFIEAKNVKKRAKFIGTVDGFEGDYQKSIEIGEEEYTIYDFCKLIGYYVSEGWTKEEKRKNRTQKCTTIQIGQSKFGKARKDIDGLFEDMFETHYDNDESISVYKPALAEYLKTNFGHGAINKKLSSFIKNLTSECLEIVIEAMMNGDGCECNKIDEFRKNTNSAYYTSSPQLANDFAEIAFKCGYTVKISECNKKENSKRYFNKTGHEYTTNLQQYVVYISKGLKGKNPVLESKSKKYANREISKEQYSGKIYCFEVPYNLFVTMRRGKIAIQGNSAQVGIEVLIRRLDNWRNKLKEWVEKHIFLPIAMMQGFIDESESEMLGETVYLYPKLVWNDLQLRDKTNKIQTLMQWYDKGGVSMQTICEEMDLDYDAEIEKIREEQVMAGPQGQMPGGGNLGTMGMGGGDMGGGMPGGDMAGAMPGGDMGGAPGGAPGGMPGGDMGMGGAAPMGAAAGADMPKITKRGGGGAEQEQEQPQPQMIKFTKLEQQMLKVLQQIPSPHELFAQYQVKVPGEQRPFVLDFAYPQIGVGVETDGAIWHQREDFQQRDMVRDQKLANVGWRILRFRDDAVEEQTNAVKEVIAKNIIEATKSKKSANDRHSLMKYAAGYGESSNPIYDYMVANEGKVGVNIIEMPNKMGQLILIGTV